MSPSLLSLLFKPARIDIGAFIGVAWGGVAITALCFVLRISIRLRTLRRLFLDDYLILLAWLMLLANAVIWQVEKNDLYDSIAVLSGDLNQPLENFIRETENSLRAIAAVVILFYSSLWCIKFSFLLFFRPLGDKVKRQRLLWWTVFVITAASYFACVGTVEYKCLTSSFSYLETQCATRSAINRQRLSLHYNTAMDVITDALIILVPVNLLWKVQMSLRRRLALASLFSMTILIMVFAIVRVIVVSSYSHQPDQTWLFMWDSIEQTVAILVACLFSFRALFMRSSRGNRLSKVENPVTPPRALFPFKKSQYAIYDSAMYSLPETMAPISGRLDGSNASHGSGTSRGNRASGESGTWTTYDTQASNGSYDLPTPPTKSAVAPNSTTRFLSRTDVHV